MDCVYFGRALGPVRERLGLPQRTFYLTWDLHELPEYGPHVIAIVLGDEDARVPAYAGSVGAVFKCYGSRPFVGRVPVFPPSRGTLLVALQGLRRWARHVPDGLRRRGGDRRAARAIHPIPLGYYNQLDLPLSDFSSRETSVYFAGSLVRSQRPPWSPRRWLGQPAPVVRQEMVDALQVFARRHPHHRVNMRLTPSFASHRRSDAATYSAALMDAKICLAPRGGSVETYRYFEALRYGCVVITEPLPETWFYSGSPAVVVRRWRQLPDVLAALLEDSRGLVQRHQASLDWWRDTCGEDALGRYLINELSEDREVDATG